MVDQENESGQAQKTRPVTRRSGARACVHCHQRKIRCDITVRGAPCSSCASLNTPDCRLFQRKRERLSARRNDSSSPQKHHKPVPLRPRRAESAARSSPLSRTASNLSDGGESAGTEPAAPESTGPDHDPGNLADFLGKGEVRSKVIDHRGRMCYIGTEMSNFNYLVRQSSLALPGDANPDGLHFGNRQFQRRHTAHNLDQVPREALQRPEKKLADRLIGAYFERINRGWPVVDEGDFMLQYEGRDARLPLPLTLFNAVCMVGAFALASEDEEGMAALQAVFFRRAKTLVEYRYDQDRTLYVQVALLMTWHSDGLEEVVANAWYWIGVAARTAQGLGMHRDVTRSRMLPVHKRLWTRLWWVLVQFDTIVAASYGKPQVINLDESDVPELEPAHFEGMPLAEVDFAIYHSRLCAIISRTMRERWALRASTESKINASKKADGLLAEFMMQMPSSLQAPLSSINVWQATLHLSYNQFVILLHRPPPQLGNISAVQDEASRACSDAKVCGDANLTIASIFDSLLGRGLLPRIWLYANHALFTALIHVANESASANPIMVAKYHKMFDVLIESLRELAKRWRFAQGLLQLFEERSLRVREQAREKNAERSAQSEGGPANNPTDNDRVDVDNQDQSFSLGTLTSSTSVPVGSGLDTDGIVASPYDGDYMGLDPTTQVYGDLWFANMPFLDTHSLDFFLGEINTN